MKWNVIFRDYNTGRLKPYNIFEHTDFRIAVEQLIAKKYDKLHFVKELNAEAHFYFWAKIEWELFFTTWPPRINTEEIERIIREYHTERKPGETLPELLDVHPETWYKIDVYAQLQANWDRFADSVWEESQK